MISFMKKFMILLIKGDDYTVEKGGKRIPMMNKMKFNVTTCNPENKRAGPLLFFFFIN